MKKIKQYKTLEEIQEIPIMKFDKVDAMNYSQRLIEFLFDSYGSGDYNPQVYKIKGMYGEEGFVFSGETMDVSIYDALLKNGESQDECQASHYIVESEGMILVEIYVWYDSVFNVNVFDIKKFSKGLTRQFKQVAYQILNGNFKEQGYKND